MKSMEKKLFSFFGAMACCFFFGLAQHQVNAIPTIIPTCGANSCCEPLYAWWTSQYVFCAQVAGTKDPSAQGANTTHAIPGVYVPAATQVGCKLVPSGTYDRWVWPDAYFSCQTAPGVYPSVQQVNPFDGPPTVSATGLTRLTCGK